jgi:hypothetical protein
MVAPGTMPGPITRTNYPDIVSAVEVLPGFQLADNCKFDKAIIINSIYQLVFIERGENGRAPGPAFIIEVPANPHLVRFYLARVEQNRLV